MKKVFYTIAFTLMLFLFYSEVVVYAGGSDPGGGLIDKLVTGEKIKVELDGSIIVTNYDRIATSTTRYGTIGYTVKRSDAAIGKTDSFMLPLTAVTTIKNENDGIGIPGYPEIAEGYMLSIDKIESGKLYIDRYLLFS